MFADWFFTYLTKFNQLVSGCFPDCAKVISLNKVVVLLLLTEVVLLYTVPLLNNEEVIHTCTVVDCINHKLRSTDGIFYHEFRSKTNQCVL